MPYVVTDDGAQIFYRDLGVDGTPVVDDTAQLGGLDHPPRGPCVDYDADRAPLLFVAGEKDHIMPPSVNRSNARHYHRSPAVTEYRELAGRDHWTCGAPGWEGVADLALEWALDHARTDQPWVDARTSTPRG